MFSLYNLFLFLWTVVCLFLNSLANLRIKQLESDSMLQFALRVGVRGDFQQPKLRCFLSTFLPKLQVAASHTCESRYQPCVAPRNKHCTHVGKLNARYLDPLTGSALKVKPGKRRVKRADLLCRVWSDTVSFSGPRTLCSSSQAKGMELQQVVGVLKSMASPSLAGS